MGDNYPKKFRKAMGKRLRKGGTSMIRDYRKKHLTHSGLHSVGKRGGPSVPRIHTSSGSSRMPLYKGIERMVYIPRKSKSVTGAALYIRFNEDVNYIAHILEKGTKKRYAYKRRPSKWPRRDKPHSRAYRGVIRGRRMMRTWYIKNIDTLYEPFSQAHDDVWRKL